MVLIISFLYKTGSPTQGPLWPHRASATNTSIISFLSYIAKIGALFPIVQEKIHDFWMVWVLVS
jgi:hypothetical protein